MVFENTGNTVTMERSRKIIRTFIISGVWIAQNYNNIVIYTSFSSIYVHRLSKKTISAPLLLLT